MKTDSKIIHYASKQDYLKRRASTKSAANAHSEAKSLSDKKEEIKDKVKDKVKETKEAGSHLLGQAVSAAIKAVPTPSLPSLPVGIEASSHTPAVTKTAASEPEVINKPGIYFVTGFSINPFADDFEGLGAMAENIPQAQKFNWNQKEDLIADIKKRPRTQPILLIGEGMGSDTIVDVANELNSTKEGFRKVDLMVTINSVGTDNDIIPQNVGRNVNFISDEDSLFNDGPNVARNKVRTQVSNELLTENASDLGSSADVQFSIYEHVNDILMQAVQRKKLAEATPQQLFQSFKMPQISTQNL